jgi:hypothetical protein
MAQQISKQLVLIRRSKSTRMVTISGAATPGGRNPSVLETALDRRLHVR